jgi:hypothetical protein
VIGTALALTLLMPVMQAGAATDPLLNEFVFNHVDIDIAEFAEVAGDPSTDYGAFTVIEIEGRRQALGRPDSRQRT